MKKLCKKCRKKETLTNLCYRCYKLDYNKKECRNLILEEECEQIKQEYNNSLELGKV